THCMDSTPERKRAISAARAHLDRGFRFEQGGSSEKALGAYRDALNAGPTAAEQIESRLRIARVYRSVANWVQSAEESAIAVHLADEAGADDLAAEAMNVQVGALQSQGFYDE